MRVLILTVLLAGGLCGPASATSTEALIDALTKVGSTTPGADDTGVYDAFMATDPPIHFQAGLLGEPPPEIPLPMRKLVRRGVAALPYLLAHLRDERATGLRIKGDGEPVTFGGAYFIESYDPRPPVPTGCQDCNRNDEILGDYTVKVGDLCYVLVGQIVNRRLVAVRYQPTMLVYVSSPIHSPVLAERTRNDWSHLTREGFKASLLADLHDTGRTWLNYPALERLRFYYPDTYATLSGKDMEMRAAFEAAEKNR